MVSPFIGSLQWRYVSQLWHSLWTRCEWSGQSRLFHMLLQVELSCQFLLQVSLHIGNSLVRCTLDKEPDVSVQALSSPHDHVYFLCDTAMMIAAVLCLQAFTYGVATPDSSVAENEVCGSLISDHEVDVSMHADYLSCRMTCLSFSQNCHFVRFT